MKFKPAVWFPIASILSVINLGAVWFAARPGEPWHATGHAVLAVAFGLWANRLRRGPRADELSSRELESLEIEMGNLRQQLGEAQERLDFTERMMAREPEVRRVDPER